MEVRKARIGIFGSAEGASPEVYTAARRLGLALSHHDVTLVTGGCSGLPYAAAEAAYREAGTEVRGYTPAKDLVAHRRMFPVDDPEIYGDQLIFVARHDPRLDNVLVARKYRNLWSTEYCDAGLIVSGRVGTMNEFTLLYDLGKVIGVLSGTGGTADFLPSYMAAIDKASRAKVIYDHSPEDLVEKVVGELDLRGLAA